MTITSSVSQYALWCAELMLGVSVPVIYASLDKGGVIFAGLLMFVISILLLLATRMHNKLAIKLLLVLHIVVALFVLIGISLYKPHIFLICWSMIIILLASASWVKLRNEKNI